MASGRHLLAHTKIVTARHEDSGVACHESLNEHHYSPRPVWLAGTRPGSDVLRPAVRDGKVSFSYYGVNHPDTADHARSWLGNILRQEQEAGELGTVEFIVSRDSGNNLQRHYCWHVWKASATDPVTRGPGVEVWLHISTATGVAIEVLGGPDEEVQNHVRGLLCQFCDVGDIKWNPIPDPPGDPKVQKVHRVREIPEKLRKPRLLGHKMPEAGNNHLLSCLAEWQDAESQVLDCLAAIKASQAQGASEELLEQLTQLQQAFMFATEKARLRLRPEWRVAASAALDLLLKDPELCPRAETLSLEMFDYITPAR
eukprot:TRINITY_DN23651_c0_g1_i1.p1 TRINITY_DN23651_c0_g1~~TRINITY_DN23651_c0_g1_i1.p1  ORF type:complete len:323 (-),score=57.15 TRINITY_DN23651_c0_g1_i1:113-1051(-)